MAVELCVSADYNRGRMRVTINIPQSLQEIADRKKVTQVSGNTVGDCLNDLIKQFPGLQKHIFDKHGRLHGYLEVLINKKSAFPEELTKPVADGDEMQILNIIVGG